MKRKLLSILLGLVCVVGLSSCEIIEELLNGTSQDHTHTYETQSDSAGHWEECDCGEKTTKVEHTFETKYDENGHYNECSVCGYKTLSTSHTLEKKYDSTGHWDECECGYTTTKVSHTLQIKYNATGHYYQCSCGYTTTCETHSYQYDGDNTEHYQKCSVCGQTTTKSNHSFGNVTVVTASTAFTKGTGEKTCSVCGKKVTVELDYDLSNVTSSEVIGAINAIDSDSTYDYLDSIHNAYNALSTSGKEEVTNISTFNNIYEPVTEVIASIDTLSLTYIEKSLKTNINNARTLYDSLATSNQHFVSNYETLTNIEDTISGLSAKQQAIVNTALAFDAQGSQIQYEQRLSRRNLSINPEDANSYSWVFQDCSSFCNSVYQYVMGYSVISGLAPSSINTANIDAYAQQYVGTNPDVILATDNRTTMASYTSTQLIDMLEVGDVYTYRHGSAGHIMLYIGDYKGDGNKYFIHCTGNSGTTSYAATDPTDAYLEQQSSTEKSSGAIVINNVNDVFVNTTHTRYYLDSENDSWSIIRPLSRIMSSSGKAMSELTMKTEGINKLVNPNIDSEKSCSVNNYHSVTNNSTLTYTITIKNTGSSAVNGIHVEENIPENVTYVSNTNGGTVSDNKIVWKIASINANSSITLTYTYKVSGEVGDSIDDFYTYVNGTRINMMQHDIRKDGDLTTFETNITNLLGKSYTSAILAVCDAYNDTYGSNTLKTSYFGSYTAENTMIYYYFDSNDYPSSIAYTSLTPSNMYGGTSHRSEFTATTELVEYNNSFRNVLPQYLETGDIICARDGSTYRCFIYVNSTTVYNVVDGVICSGNQPVATTTYTTAPTGSVTEFLHTLPWYDYFFIIRPTLAA